MIETRTRGEASAMMISVRGVSTLLFLVLLLLDASIPEERRRAFELQAETPQFWSVIDRNEKLTTIASGFGFTEGPVWDEAGFLYVSDETLNKIFRVYPNGKKDELISLGD